MAQPRWERSLKSSAFVFALGGVAVALILLLVHVKPEEPYRPSPPRTEKQTVFQTAATAACRCAHKPGADGAACWSPYRQLTKASGGQVGSTLAAQNSMTSECFGDFESPDRFCVTLEVSGRGTCTWDEPSAGENWPSMPDYW